MKVTEDDRQPNAFSPAAERKWHPGLDKWGTGRCNYMAADLQLVHATALCDRAVTRFTLAPSLCPPPSQSLITQPSLQTEYVS